MAEINFNLPKNKKSIYTVPASRGNAITQNYYWFLVGEINRGTIHKAVCRIFYPDHNYTSYHLISL